MPPHTHVSRTAPPSSPLRPQKKLSTKSTTSAQATVEISANEQIWDRLHDSRGAVRGPYQFREGDFETGFKARGLILRPLGLWEILTNAAPLSEDASDQERDEREVLDSWAVNHTQPFICDSILDRWTLERPVHGPRLLKFLETACRPFRLLDLPQELKDHVFDHCTFALPTYLDVCPGLLETSDGRDAQHFAERVTMLEPLYKYDHKRKRWLLCSRKNGQNKKWENGVVMSQVSHEFRDAMEKRQFGRCELELAFWEGHKSFEELLEWINSVGMRRLRHLRSIRVRMWPLHEGFDIFSVSYDPIRGLTASHESTGLKQKADLSDYIRTISESFLEEDGNSTGVVEFFTYDPDSLRVATGCFSEEHVGEDYESRDGFHMVEDDEGLVKISSVIDVEKRFTRWQGRTLWQNARGEWETCEGS